MADGSGKHREGGRRAGGKGIGLRFGKKDGGDGREIGERADRGEGDAAEGWLDRGASRNGRAEREEAGGKRGREWGREAGVVGMGGRER